jgi:Icc-related predicted phosphoesterase
MWEHKNLFPSGMVFVAGNHDGLFQTNPDKAKALVHRYGIHYLEDSGVTLHGRTFWGSPYTPKFFDWWFMEERGEDINRHWKMIPPFTDVLITHGPPQGYLDTLWDGPAGCLDLKKRLFEVKPRLHVFGHIHSGFGMRELRYEDNFVTILVNAAQISQDNRLNDPVVIDLD